MSNKEPKIITADMIEFMEKPWALVQSTTNEAVGYNVNYEEKTCDCLGFQYCKKDPKECKHLTSVLRLIAIKSASSNIQ